MSGLTHIVHAALLRLVLTLTRRQQTETRLSYRGRASVSSHLGVGSRGTANSGDSNKSVARRAPGIATASASSVSCCRGEPPSLGSGRMEDCAKPSPAANAERACASKAGRMYRIGVDIGGTFTDFALFDVRGARMSVDKRLTTPQDPSEAVIEGIDALLK